MNIQAAKPRTCKQMEGSDPLLHSIILQNNKKRMRQTQNKLCLLSAALQNLD
jgi:hypothetical protein